MSDMFPLETGYICGSYPNIYPPLLAIATNDFDLAQRVVVLPVISDHVIVCHHHRWRRRVLGTVPGRVE
jgi:hypothetical protein